MLVSHLGAHLNIDASSANNTTLALRKSAVTSPLGSDTRVEHHSSVRRFRVNIGLKQQNVNSNCEEIHTQRAIYLRYALTYISRDLTFRLTFFAGFLYCFAIVYFPLVDDYYPLIK
jgi:hypothetical protein